jgi:hypothetical protein
MASGDIRVHLVMNAVLSAVYAAAVVWGLSYVGVMAYSVSNVAAGTAITFALTYVLVLR